MNVEELVAQAKRLIEEKDLSGAKDFITKHKDELGEHVDDLTKLLGDNASPLVGKIKGLFGKK